MRCNVDDCPHSARRKGLCWGHLKRRMRLELGLSDRPVNEPLLPRKFSPFGLLAHAAIRYADADPTDDIEWLRARKALAKAAERYIERRPKFRRR